MVLSVVDVLVLVRFVVVVVALALALVVLVSLKVWIEGSTGVVFLLVAVTHAQQPRTLAVSDGRSCVTPQPPGQRRAQRLTASDLEY